MPSIELPPGVDTKIFIQGPGCLAEVPSMVAQVNPSSLPLILIQDEHTKAAAGQALAQILSEQGIPFSELLLVPGSLGVIDPDHQRVVAIAEHIKKEQAFPVAVGSGTINDLVKRAAFELDIPYACVGTAASVDGYSAFGASLVQGGYKITMPCPAPAAVAADTDVLLSAPYDMTASGYGDLYAKLAAGVDWFLADRLGIEKIDPPVWDMVQKDLPLWVAEPGKLKGGDSTALSNVFRGLTMSGCAMQIYKDSRPASGAEHLISHIWEMEHLSKDGLPVSHGFKVAMGTLISVSLMEAFYSLSPEDISVEACRPHRETWEERRLSIAGRFPDPQICEMVEKASRDKWLDDDQWTARIRQLGGLLGELKTFAVQRLGSRDKVRADLIEAGCPVSPQDFGVSPEGIKDAVIKAQMIRKRYTIMDALYETGQLGPILDRLF
ncbi:MAG: sn-glycerol-1-phosphate dehydrogenase [Treponema sp.]|nr:sn-glycerol-1-phosphate dehydrogenase [Treponema sp.]